jgi:hypothetical protein
MYILLVRHILETVLAVDLGTRFVELVAHREIDRVPRKAGRLTLIALLRLHPGDEEDLGDDYAPENAPDSQDTFEGVGLKMVLA